MSLIVLSSRFLESACSSVHRQHTAVLICCFRFAAAGPGEYFARGQHAEVAQAYCKGGRKMLVFAVLMDSSGLTARRAAPLPRPRPLPHLSPTGAQSYKRPVHETRIAHVCRWQCTREGLWYLLE